MKKCHTLLQVADVVRMAMNSNAPLLSARALQVCASFADERWVVSVLLLLKMMLMLMLMMMLVILLAPQTASHQCRAVSGGRGISKEHIVPLLSIAVQRTGAEHQPPVRIMAIQVGDGVMMVVAEDLT